MNFLKVLKQVFIKTIIKGEKYVKGTKSDIPCKILKKGKVKNHWEKVQIKKIITRS